MTSKPAAFLLADLGVTQSHSRPHVSNDNPYSEAQFKTLKYRPDFPGQFASIEGPSPGGKWQLPAGIRGTFAGASVTTFRGRLAPTGGASVRGFLGVKDFACSSADIKGRCTGTWDWLRDYFTGVAGFRYSRYEFRYHATENGTGTFADKLAGGKIRYTGDIKPAKPKNP